MGIRPYKAFTFDGESSLDYGVYLTGEGVFNAPERAVEMVEIPGRNGNFVLDKGRFQNITVTYKAGMVDYSETDFATRVSNVRNWLCSRVGYCRLEDDYNPNEYRMAAFVSGIEVDHADLQTGEFEITFDCKPQRWLTSGETAVSVTSGDEITNPTLFASSPQLQVWGYGDITLGNDLVTVNNVVIGDIIIAGAQETTHTYITSNEFGDASFLEVSSLESGDTITADGVVFTITGTTYGGATISSAQVASTSNCSASVSSTSRETVTVKITLPQFITHYTSEAGTYDTVTSSASFSVVTNAGTKTMTVNMRRLYFADCYIEVYGSITYSTGFSLSATAKISTPSIRAYSTRSIAGNPLYIDFDTGEAWKVEGGEIVALNSGVSIPAELPTLAPGDTEITYDNTITRFDIVPRWWKI